MSRELALPLEGLYLHLVRNGFPLSVRDYQDALTALRRGYGLHRREELYWLCETLWARTDQERIRLARLFRTFPWLKPEQVRDLTGSEGPSGTETTKADSPSRQVANVGNNKQAPTIEFATPAETGVALPRAWWRATGGEVFIFTPRPQISLRSLIIAWRRFRRAQRSGPRVELDIDATIAEQCRRGMLAEPVLLPARRNQARLAVLVDASPSMVPWHHLNTLIAESLRHSQLAHAALYFFDNVPEEDLFESYALTRPIPLLEILKQNSQCALLILSDGGSARGQFNRGRLTQTNRFLRELEKHGADWRPIVWANPMPRQRWTGTTAERIAGLPGVDMMELSEDGLIQAVDYLRGKRSV